MSASALQNLMAARAKIVNPENWGKGQRYNRERPESYCVTEAIEVTAPTIADRRKAMRALHRAIGNPRSLMGWNDARDRTHAEALAAFDRAIAEHRGAV